VWLSTATWQGGDCDWQAVLWRAVKVWCARAQALSRGCERATFVELDPWVTQRCLQPNIDACELRGGASVVTTVRLRICSFLYNALYSYAVSLEGGLQPAKPADAAGSFRWLRIQAAVLPCAAARRMLSPRAHRSPCNVPMPDVRSLQRVFDFHNAGPRTLLQKAEAFLGAGGGGAQLRRHDVSSGQAIIFSMTPAAESGGVSGAGGGGAGVRRRPLRLHIRVPALPPGVLPRAVPAAGGAHVLLKIVLNPRPSALVPCPAVQE
jgi:hypothetical protein